MTTDEDENGERVQVGDVVLAQLADRWRIRGTIRRRTKTHATVDVEKRFEIDDGLHETTEGDDSEVITLDQVLRRRES